ncbi:TlpA family protein disulfide reductase [Solitalea koreensis]|uniref:Thiol-disulfide isomerase or thioredoxin n=1 Tax=Solitalea koreensis TaxID=543615 RepID=A0A521AVK8_9SPHI|nr:TlpA disulfide reductase family protein [Solitalea koreensis]SMO38824.1 Thiol-disulfide isomerase or thioredoxin [Solitalea koreensis]
MKKLLTIAVLLLFHICASAQMTEVRGTIKSATPGKQPVYLFKIEDGETKLVKAASATSDGFFVFSFEPDYIGFYMIGGFTSQAGQFPVYLKKGDKAEVMFDNRQMEFVGKQTEENTVLSSWTTLTKELKSQTSEFSLVKDKMMAFQKNIRTRNETFNRLMKQVVNFEMDFYVLNLIKKNAGSASESLAEYGRKFLVKDNYKNDDVFSYPNGKALISLYADYAASVNKAGDGLNFLSTDRQKGIYIFSRMNPNIKTYAQFEDMTNKYGKYFQDQSLKAKVDALGTKLYNATPGRKGANFSYPDKDGKMVSLSDFKGKVLLVDVWATFCGPCKELMPALNKLEAELHDNKDIAFVSVAFDGPRGKDTWLKMIKDMQMGGTQLFAGGRADKVNVLQNDYKIKVMPRYLVFDRQGNVVTAEAPLPNNPALKELLLAQLGK